MATAVGNRFLAPPRLAWLAVLAIGALGSGAHGQYVAPKVVPPVEDKLPAAEPADPPEDLSSEKAIPLKEGIKQLKKIRMKHFGQIRNTEIRQLGIAKLKDYNESKFYPHLLELFADEQHDVRGAVLDLLADQKDERADTAIAYAAVFDKDAWFRQEATKRLLKRKEQWLADKAQQNDHSTPQLQTPAAAKSDVPAIPPGLDSGMPWRVKAVIQNGLMQKNDAVAGAAANLAADMKVFDLIPALVNAQLGGATGVGVGGGGNGNGDAALAYILVGKQQAFVSDLTPVVGDSAVAFDPTLSVATSGTVLRVIDAAVITYRTEIHYALNRLANSGWDGRKVDPLGYDQNGWHDWYAHEFLPFRQDVAEGRVVENPNAPH